MAIQWPLLAFSLLAGCGGATLAFAGVSEVLGVARKTRAIAVIVALCLLVVGGCASVAHLQQPANIMAAAANVFGFSGISVELIMLGVNFVVGIAYVAMLKREASASALKAAGVVAIASGVVMAFVVGNGYVMESQRYWNTVALPLAYMGSGLACGGCLFCSLMAARREEREQVAKMGAVALVAIIVQLAAFVAWAAATGFAVDAGLYWGGAVAIGCAGTLALGIAARKAPAAWFGACACALAGGIALRAVMWMLGYGFIEAFTLAAGRVALGV